MATKFQKKIMRGVYYTYAIRLVLSPGVVHGFFMLAMLITLTYFVSIGNVIHNLMNAQVGNVGTFFYNAVTNTEAWTLIVLMGIMMAALSLRFKLIDLRPKIKYV